MNIGWHILQQEDAEAARARRAAPKPTAQAQLVEVDRQIAALKAQLDPAAGDDESVWPLRRELVSLSYKRRDLLEGGTHR
jgi:hypothetical protein